MKEPVNLRELVGGDLPPEELEKLGRVDGMLRSVPAPPHDVPASLTQAVAAVPLQRRRPTRRRLAVAVAFAALIAVAAFGIGRWTADELQRGLRSRASANRGGPCGRSGRRGR